MDHEWTANALFSPSKARVQQAQAKDWAAVDAWLAKRYGSRMPSFERNEDTLQTLLALANLNESADDQRSQIERIEKAALQSLPKRAGDASNEVLHAMEAELVNETHLDILAESVVALDCPSTDAATIASKIVETVTDSFEMKQQVQRVQAQLAAIKNEQARTLQVLKSLKSDTFQPPPDIIDHTADWTKSSKHLKAKVAEYEDRIAASRPSSRQGEFEAYSRKVEEVKNLKEELSLLEFQLKAFADLPSDPSEVRVKVKEAREHLQTLTARRDRMVKGRTDS